MWTIFTVFIDFVITLLLFYVGVFWPQVMWDLSSFDRGSNPCLLHLLHYQEGSLPLSHVPLEAQAVNSVKSLKEETVP